MVHYVVDYAKGYHGSIVPWSVTDPDAKMNSFNWSKQENDWIVIGDQYNEQFNNWQGLINKGQFCSQNIKEKINTEETCSKSSGSFDFNGIPREGNPEIPIKSHKDKCRDHIIWDVFSLTDPPNKDKKWEILIHQSRFSLEYIKLYVQSLQKGSEADQYVVQNLTWSGVYLRSTLLSGLLQKILKLVPLTATGPEIYVAAMNIVFSGSYNYLVDTLNHMNILKLKDHPGGGVANFYDAI